MSCAAPDQNTASAAPAGATVIEGTVVKAGTPVGGAYVRLHDGTGEFTAEVVSGAEGQFRFYAVPGDWELRALSSAGRGTNAVTAAVGTTSAELVLA